MRVFAEYTKVSEQVRFRRKTLLKFGNSTKLIGSAVLMNPGSAEPLGSADMPFIKAFFKDVHHYEITNESEWYEFKPDATMRQLQRLFSGYFQGENKPLDGVIQLFNLSYYKDQDLSNAKKEFEKYPEYYFNEFDFLSDKPVYFGWGEIGKSGELSDIAYKLFNSYDIFLTPIYDPIFENNKFTHPRRIQLQYGRSKEIKDLADNFCKLI